MQNWPLPFLKAEQIITQIRSDKRLSREDVFDRLSNYLESATMPDKQAFKQALCFTVAGLTTQKEG